MNVFGHCEARFSQVREEFERNFAERGEVGASVCVIVDGEPVVDLWGGLANRGTGTPWQRDTLGLVWSCTKGAVALCAHVLVQRGFLDLDAPIAVYWPEFARQGKGTIPVRWVLNHQAGLPAIRQPMKPGDLYEWDVVTGHLANMEPFWAPGTAQGYHALTFGYLMGEIVRRITGLSIGEFFRQELSGPLNLDFHLGLPESEELRVAPTIRADPVPRGEVPWRFLTVANTDQNSIQALLIRNTGRFASDQDTRHAHAAELPSMGAITNSRGLAGLYEPLTRGRLVDRDVLARMQEVSSATAIDAVLLVGLRFSLGFMKSSDNRAGPPGAQDSILLSPTAFGHAGMGGSLGFADPSANLAFGYTMNKQGRGVLLNPRGQALVDAAYRCLGRKSCSSGFWL